MQVMKDFVVQQIEGIVDENKKVKHSKLSEMTEEVGPGTHQPVLRSALSSCMQPHSIGGCGPATGPVSHSLLARCGGAGEVVGWARVQPSILAIPSTPSRQ